MLLQCSFGNSTESESESENWTVKLWVASLAWVQYWIRIRKPHVCFHIIITAPLLWIKIRIRIIKTDGHASLRIFNIFAPARNQTRGIWIWGLIGIQNQKAKKKNKNKQTATLRFTSLAPFQLRITIRIFGYRGRVLFLNSCILTQRNL